MKKRLQRKRRKKKEKEEETEVVEEEVDELLARLVPEGRGGAGDAGAVVPQGLADDARQLPVGSTEVSQHLYQSVQPTSQVSETSKG